MEADLEALTPAQRAILAADHEGLSDREAAKRYNSSKGSINAARKLKRLSLELYENVRSGSIGLHAALRAAENGHGDVPKAPAAAKVRAAKAQTQNGALRKRPNELSRFMNWLISGAEIAENSGGADGILKGIDDHGVMLDMSAVVSVYSFIGGIMTAARRDAGGAHEASTRSQDNEVPEM